MKRSLSFSDLWTFLECPEEYLARIQRKKQKRNKEQVVGDATHAIAEQHGEQTTEIREFIRHEVALLPAEEREETLKAIEQIAANAQEMAEHDEEDDDDTDRESVHRWLFEKLGWTLCAKPDKVDFVMEGGRQIMEITDYKSGKSHEHYDSVSGSTVYRPKRKHKEQIYFFAMVVSLALGWTGPVRLRIRYWGNKAECQPIWYSHRRTQAGLEELAGYIAQIESFLASKKFPTRPGFWCKDCPLLAKCKAGQTELAWQRPVSVTRVPQLEATA